MYTFANSCPMARSLYIDVFGSKGHKIQEQTDLIKKNTSYYLAKLYIIFHQPRFPSKSGAFPY